MAYSVVIEKKVLKTLEKLDNRIYEDVVEKITALEDNPRPPGSTPLVNIGYLRIRVGDYRVIYDIDDTLKEIYILDIGHRKDIYKKYK